MRKILSILGFLVFSLLCVPLVHADNNFDTAFDVTYTANTQGNTHVVFQGTLTNTTDKYYASSYSITTGFTDAQNITARDDDGSITPDVTTPDGKTRISLNFKHKALGLNSAVHFTISFDTASVTTRVGNVWEVAVPGIADQGTFSAFTVHVNVPSSFGTLALSKPIASGGLTFTKDQLGDGGVFLVFGDAQQFNFTLNYHIKNDNVFPVKTDIALPPDTSYQKVSLDSLDPKPENVFKDADGNYMARYFLLPGQRTTVVAKGSVLLQLSPRKETLTADAKQQYLASQKYWEVGDPHIQDLAHQLKTPEAIYNYVVTHLTYDFSRVTTSQQRLGASYILDHPSNAVCLEFTDLFVTLARAAGIPAREVDGFAYTQNSRERPLSLVQDILHAWPEYYDESKGAWVMVDPTWGNTTHGIDYFNTFDFDHVAFVVKGLDSQYPVPAGGYKFDDNSKDVDVVPSVITTEQPAQATFDLAGSQQLLPWLPIHATLTITNLGPGFISGRDVHFTSSLSKISPDTISLPDIPPFGKQTMAVEISHQPILTKQTIPITIQFGSISVDKQLTIYPIDPSQMPIVYAGVSLFIAIIIIWIIAAKARRVRVSR